MILDEIVEKTKVRLEQKKKEKPFDLVKKEALSIVEQQFYFEKVLKSKEISFICEVKKASPSKGIIAEEFPYLQIAKDYEKSGANAISVLTEPYFFKGEAKILGASAVLLICSILNEDTLKKYIKIADSLGLSALVEAHDEDEIKMALRARARIIGVNNRNLKDFTVNINNSINLRKLVPEDIIFIAESGIKTSEDIEKLRKANVNAVLIGETLMRSKDKKTALEYLRGYKYE